MTTQYCHSVQFFAASCETCGHKFSLPLLSDLSYGEFILHGDMEGVFGYLSAHDEPAWKDIDGQLRRAGLLPASPKSSDIDRLQRVIAVSADAINGQRLSLFPVCDSCGAPSIACDDSKPLDARDIPKVTFSEYLQFSDEMKYQKTVELWARFGSSGEPDSPSDAL